MFWAIFLKYDDKIRDVEIAEANNKLQQAYRLKSGLNKIQNLESEINVHMQILKQI